MPPPSQKARSTGRIRGADSRKRRPRRVLRMVGHHRGLGDGGGPVVKSEALKPSSRYAVVSSMMSVSGTGRSPAACPGSPRADRACRRSGTRVFEADRRQLPSGMNRPYTPPPRKVRRSGKTRLRAARCGLRSARWFQRNSGQARPVRRAHPAAAIAGCRLQRSSIDRIRRRLQHRRAVLLGVNQVRCDASGDAPSVTFLYSDSSRRFDGRTPSPPVSSSGSTSFAVGSELMSAPASRSALAVESPRSAPRRPARKASLAALTDSTTSKLCAQGQLAPGAWQLEEDDVLPPSLRHRK